MCRHPGSSSDSSSGGGGSSAVPNMAAPLLSALPSCSGLPCPRPGDCISSRVCERESGARTGGRTDTGTERQPFNARTRSEEPGGRRRNGGFNVTSVDVAGDGQVVQGRAGGLTHTQHDATGTT